MNKCYLLVFLSVFTFAANAQIKKQSTLVGGQLNYYKVKNEFESSKQKSENATINISIGKAYKENNVVGVTIGFSPIRQSNYLNNGDTSTLTSNRFDFGLFYRAYKKLAKDFYFFSQIDGAFITANQREHYKLASADVKATQRGTSLSLTPGISYQVFKKMQLELAIPNILGMQYLVTKINSENPQIQDSKQKQMNFYSNLNTNTSLSWLGVGFRFVL